MKQELCRPNVPESPPAYYTREFEPPADVPLSKEAKKRAALRANRFSRWFVVAAFVCLGVTQSWPLFWSLAAVALAVNIAAWRYFLKLEREAAESGLLPRSIGEERQ